MVEIRLDGEKLLKHIKAIETELNQIRHEAAMGTASPFTLTGIDLTMIDWRDRDSNEISVSEPWAWAFAYDQDDRYKPESEALVKAIEQTGKVEIDGFEMTLSGRDKRLLSRKKVKK